MVSKGTQATFLTALLATGACNPGEIAQGNQPVTHTVKLVEDMLYHLSQGGASRPDDAPEVQKEFSALSIGQKMQVISTLNRFRERVGKAPEGVQMLDGLLADMHTALADGLIQEIPNVKKAFEKAFAGTGLEEAAPYKHGSDDERRTIISLAQMKARQGSNTSDYSVQLYELARGYQQLPEEQRRRVTEAMGDAKEVRRLTELLASKPLQEFSESRGR